jgi:hypothetical protein
MKKKLTTRKVAIRFRSKREQEPIQIVADAAIATSHVGQGKLIPLVILDTTGHPDVEEFIRIHTYVGPGDVTVGWVQYPKGKNNLSLHVEAARPSEVIFFIRFDLMSHWVIVDQIVRSRALYIQAGRQGDRLRTTLDKPRISIEIGDLGFDDIWESIGHEAVIRRLRSEGLSKGNAKRASSLLIQKWRQEFGDFRMDAE